MKWWLLSVAAAVVALAAAYRFEDPFLRRWPSPRERKAAERLIALHDMYETNRWT
jgi:hypothetical protein